jgi:hypothetical protein
MSESAVLRELLESVVAWFQPSQVILFGWVVAASREARVTRPMSLRGA